MKMKGEKIWKGENKKKKLTRAVKAFLWYFKNTCYVVKYVQFKGKNGLG